MNSLWESLVQSTAAKKHQLEEAYDVQKFIRAADETKLWMNEKSTSALSDDYGRDLASVQALQRKHEGLERDLDALEEKVQAHVVFIHLFIHSFTHSLIHSLIHSFIHSFIHSLHLFEG